jgi:flavin-dependent dehydrogenase
MWVLTNVGYVCAVVHKDDVKGKRVKQAKATRARDRIMVRARARHHLEALFPDADIIEWADADFRFRVIVSRASFKKWLARQAEAMNYESFKHSTADAELYRQYVRWWQIGLDYQRALEGCDSIEGF